MSLKPSIPGRRDLADKNRYARASFAAPRSAQARECDPLINHMEFLALDAWPTRAMRKRDAKSVIVVVDADGVHREQLISALRDEGYATRSSDLKGVQNDLDLSFILESAKAVIFDLTALSAATWSDLTRICGFRSIDGLPVPVICPTRVDRGPAFELNIERLGAQLLYEI